MKSEEFILQELEKDRLEKLAVEEGRPGLADSEKPNIKFMISGEAPVLMSKACELFIKDLTHRAWSHTERNRRRTLQRQDLHAAVGESEVYDFLIDIVPRVSPPTPKVHMDPPPGIPAGFAGLGGASHPGMVSAGIPHGMQMQAPATMHTGIPDAAAMPPGTMGTVQEDPSLMSQHLESQQQLAQPTQQQQYHPEHTQHAAVAASLHSHHHHVHQQQQAPSQHQQAYARGLQQDGTSPTPQSSQPGEPAPNQSELWLHNTADD
jgi:nuclear transcription factor Y gamma